jgi:hypothetical protein
MPMRAPRSTSLACLAFLALLAPALTARSKPGGGAEPRASRPLPAPEYLAPEARAELRARMGRHAATLSSLVQAVVLLDRPAIRTLASRIAEEETVARMNAPTKSGKPLPLPPQFFAELDALRENAQQLAAMAARSGSSREDDRELADRFAALARTCVGCHSVYLRGGPASEPPAPQPGDPPRP